MDHTIQEKLRLAIYKLKTSSPVSDLKPRKNMKDGQGIRNRSTTISTVILKQ